MALKPLTRSKAETIIREYAAGETMAALAARHHVRERVVRRLLVVVGVKIRTGKEEDATADYLPSLEEIDVAKAQIRAERATQVRCPRSEPYDPAGLESSRLSPSRDRSAGPGNHVEVDSRGNKRRRG
jgi:hypothetical protein